MSEWVVLLHVAVAFWFVAGMLGRNITMARARSANDLSTIVELVDLSGRFERLMVIPGSWSRGCSRPGPKVSLALFVAGLPGVGLILSTMAGLLLGVLAGVLLIRLGRSGGIDCPRCGTFNGRHSAACSACSLPLAS